MNTGTKPSIISAFFTRHSHLLHFMDNHPQNENSRGSALLSNSMFIAGIRLQPTMVWMPRMIIPLISGLAFIFYERKQKETTLLLLFLDRFMETVSVGLLQILAPPIFDKYTKTQCFKK